MEGKKRQSNFTSEEVEVLTVGVEKRAKLLFGTLGGATTAAMKQKGWEGVANEVNAVGGFGRSVTEVKKKWVCWKSQAKGKLAAVKREQQKTGGGSNDAEEVSTMDSRLLGIMGEVCVVGIEGGFDSSQKLLQDLSGIFILCYYFPCAYYHIYLTTWLMLYTRLAG